MEVTRAEKQRDQILAANLAGPLKRMTGRCRDALAEVLPLLEVTLAEQKKKNQILAAGPNSACDVGLLLELTSGLGHDRGESGGLRGVLVAPARHREKLGFLFMGIVGSGCARSRIVRLGLIWSERWISRD